MYEQIIFFIKQSTILFLFFIISYCSFAIDLYPFQSAQQQVQFNRLTKELRCLVCQNESLSSSNAKIANDLRNTVYVMVKQNNSDEVIKDYLVKRYGNFILFKPPFITTTLILWLAPFLMLVIGSFVIFAITRKGK